MDTTTKLQRVIDILKKQGCTDEQIVTLTNELTKTNFARLYSEAMASFTEEDIKAIEAETDEKAANEKIKSLYTLRTGKDPDQVAQKFLDDFCDGFMAEYEKSREQH